MVTLYLFDRAVARGSNPIKNSISIIEEAGNQQSKMALLVPEDSLLCFYQHQKFLSSNATLGGSYRSHQVYGTSRYEFFKARV